MQIVSASAPGDSPALYFTDVQIEERDGNAVDLIFHRPRDRTRMPPEARALYHRIHLTAETIREMVNCGSQDDRFTRLRDIAEDGLTGPDPDPTGALEDLESFREGSLQADLRRHRDRYSTINAALMASVAALCVLAALVIYFSQKGIGGWLDTYLTGIPGAGVTPLHSDGMMLAAGVAAYLFGLAGFCVGEILTSYQFGTKVDIDSYHLHARFRFRPNQRLMYGASLWMILLVMLGLDWLVIGIGEAHLNRAGQGEPLFGFLGGIVVALAFTAISETIHARALASMGQKAPA
ncbi:hypothetical protein AADZ90_020745 [Aestuariibius sp. 2305UL40-4]|uniref:hypothetical protein n=1 Tax=Aestuariibius violaceus TaxID=3234132 RepID=UPI00345EE64D